MRFIQKLTYILLGAVLGAVFIIWCLLHHIQSTEILLSIGIEVFALIAGFVAFDLLQEKLIRQEKSLSKRIRLRKRMTVAKDDPQEDKKDRLAPSKKCVC